MAMANILIVTMTLILALNIVDNNLISATITTLNDYLNCGLDEKYSESLFHVNGAALQCVTRSTCLQLDTPFTLASNDTLVLLGSCKNSLIDNTTYLLTNKRRMLFNRWS